MSLVTRQGKGSALTIVEMDSNFLYLEQLALSGTGSGGTGSSNPLVSVTKSELDTLVDDAALVPGQLYKISGVYKNKTDQGDQNDPLHDVLYDDGTNSGITVYLTAITEDILGSKGYGEFYNPNYYDYSTYNNTDGTELYGIWDGNNPEQSPTYSIGQVVYWGGYAWQNTTGNVGTFNSVKELDSNWVKLPYTNSHYTKVVDSIEYDYKTDYIYRRTNTKNNIDVFVSLETFQWDYSSNYHPIAVMAWGLYPKISEGIDGEIGGITDVSVSNSYVELVNFKGRSLSMFNVEKYATISDNYFGKDTYFYNITLDEWSDIQSNSLISSDFESLKLTNNSGINNNTLRGSNINDCTLYDSNIDSNIIETGSIYRNTLVNSSISGNTFNTGYGYINENTLNNNSYIDNNNVYGYISVNTLDNSEINSNTLNSFYIQGSNLSGGSGISNIVLSSGNLSKIRLFNSYLNFSSMMNNITNVVADNLGEDMRYNAQNLSSSSYIYQSYAKSIVKGPTSSNYYVNHFSGTQSQYDPIQF